MVLRLVGALFKPVVNERSPGTPLVGSLKLRVDGRKQTRDALTAGTSVIKMLWSIVGDPLIREEVPQVRRR